jgi:hypothetical protein
MIHLGFFRIVRPACELAGSTGKSIELTTPDQPLALAAIKPPAGKPLSKFLPARINRLQASQNAAALLFDLGMVDIR